MRVVVVHAQNMAVLAIPQRTYVNAMINVQILVIVVMTMKNFVQGVVMEDHLEKFVMNKVHLHTFAKVSETRKRDRKLRKRIAVLQQFVQLKHLASSGVEKCIDRVGCDNAHVDELLGDAIASLQRVSDHSSPSNKLISLFNGCQIVQTFLERMVRAARETTGGH